MGNGNSNTHTQYESQEILFAPFFFIEYYELHTHFLLVVGSLVYSAFSIDFLLVSYWNFVDIIYLNFFLIENMLYIFLDNLLARNPLLFLFSFESTK